MGCNYFFKLNSDLNYKPKDDRGGKKIIFN